jgi:large subunit ribosomal protein L9
MSRMKVVLRQPVSKLGDVGDLVTVAGGFARNYLIPRGLAVPATKGNVVHAETWRQSRSAREAREQSQAEQLKIRLEAEPLRVTAQAGPDGRLFGSVTAAQIADAIAAQLGAEIDRHRIELPESIRHLGLHEVGIPVYGDVTARVTLEVVEEPTG